MENSHQALYYLGYAILLLAALYVAFRIISLAFFKSYFDVKIWFESKRKKGEEDDEGKRKDKI